MAYLDTYTQPLTAKTAAHLLRRGTFGPTQQEIIDFTGMTAINACNTLINNSDFNVPEPIDLDNNLPTRGQQYINIEPFKQDRTFEYNYYIKLWWIGLMAKQQSPSILDKLTLFWQNHFVTTVDTVDEYRFQYKYLKLLRTNALGSFRLLVTEITKDPAMLKYLNGNENVKGTPNENYARELQELFTVGEKDYFGNKNYTEADVKEVAKVLTGWKYIFESNQYGSYFKAADHEEANKTFSSHYNNTIISGHSGETAGVLELNDLVTMLLNHPETSKYICRKLYRWFVNPNVTISIENNVIIPLAQLFASPSNNYEIQPIIQKLLTCEHFYDESNVGAIIKSPAEIVVGAMRFYNFQVPTANTTDVSSFYNYTSYLYYQMKIMQLDILSQPSVFGYDPYYQTGYSRVWINSTTLGLRGGWTDSLVWGSISFNSTYFMKIDKLALAASAEVPNDAFSIVERFTRNIFATGLDVNQKNFLTDTIMMMGIPRTSWTFEYNRYLANPNNDEYKGVILYRTHALLIYILRMAEYQVC